MRNCSRQCTSRREADVGHRRRPSQQAAHAQDELLHAEGLDDVVVGAGREPFDPRLLGRARREEDDGTRFVRGAARRRRQMSRPSKSGSI